MRKGTSSLRLTSLTLCVLGITRLVLIVTRCPGEDPRAHAIPHTPPGAPHLAHLALANVSCCVALLLGGHATQLCGTALRLHSSIRRWD